jgi:hypothetical protein
MEEPFSIRFQKIITFVSHALGDLIINSDSHALDGLIINFDEYY